MTHPYESLTPGEYWRTGVASHNPLDTTGLWTPKKPLGAEDRVMTFGSCFAQHISRALMKSGFTWVNAEPGPEAASPELLRKFNYGIFSARTGNIYTAKALRQWVEWADGRATPPEEVWEQDGRFFDPFRPAIEPDGFASREELLAARQTTLTALKDGIRDSSVFVFTLGLTEAWENRAEGYTYATCPGTNAGTFDAEAHAFVNYDYVEVHEELTRALACLREMNPGIRILLTVSPVPLTATAAGQHVLLSTTYSKSVLRAVAGRMTETHADIDYFPSYEIIVAPSFRGMFYDPNMRTVSLRGVAYVMEHFMAGQNLPAAPDQPAPQAGNSAESTAAPETAKDDLRCEEEILDAFARPGSN